MTNRFLAPLTFAATMIAGAASATCDSYDAFSDPEAEAGLAVIADTDASPIQRLRAFRALSCAEDPILRALAIDTALAKGPETMKSQVKNEILFGRQTLVLEPFDNGALTDPQKSWIEGHPSIALTLSFKDPQANCIGLYYDDCRANYVMDISGSGIAFSLSSVGIGELLMTESGQLEGFMVPHQTTLRVPVRARLK